MKIFFVVLILSGTVGGFIGGEITSTVFSPIGAFLGVLLSTITIFGMGAFFHAQENKKKLPAEISGVFSRMLGPNNDAPPKNFPNIDIEVHKSAFLNVSVGMINTMLPVLFPDPENAFSELMTNRKAAGYLFGFHDALLQKMVYFKMPEKDEMVKLIEISYIRLFGSEAGTMLFEGSLRWQDDADFGLGRMVGGNDIHEFHRNKTIPMGLKDLIKSDSEG